VFQVGPKFVENRVLTSPDTGLKVSESRLKLPIAAQHFQEGYLSAKCVASMLTMHWQSADVIIKEESPTLASVLDHSNGAKNASTKTTAKDTSKKTLETDEQKVTKNGRSHTDHNNSGHNEAVTSGSCTTSSKTSFSFKAAIFGEMILL
jgi:hypothetical protein